MKNIKREMGNIAYIYGLLVIASILFSIVIFTGRRVMLKYNYFNSLLFLMVISSPLNIAFENPKEDYMYILITLIIFVPMYIFFISVRKESYLIENVKVKDLINIITKYFDDNNINYEVEKKEIYLSKYYKTIDITGNKELILDLKEIKKLNFYEELLEYIKCEIKDIKEKSFPVMGLGYLIYAGAFYFVLDFMK